MEELKNHCYPVGTIGIINGKEVEIVEKNGCKVCVIECEGNDDGTHPFCSAAIRPDGKNVQFVELKKLSDPEFMKDKIIQLISKLSEEKWSLDSNGCYLWMDMMTLVEVNKKSVKIYQQGKVRHLVSIINYPCSKEYDAFYSSLTSLFYKKSIELLEGANIEISEPEEG